MRGWLQVGDWRGQPAQAEEPVDHDKTIRAVVFWQALRDRLGEQVASLKAAVEALGTKAAQVLGEFWRAGGGQAIGQPSGQFL